MSTIPYRAEYKSAWYQAHKEEAKIQHKKRYEENKEKILAQVKLYHENNKGKVDEVKKEPCQQSKEEYLQQRKDYYAENKERIIAGVKKYREANKEAIKERNRKKNYGIEPGTFDKMILEQDNKCCICHIELDKCKQISIDHCHKSGNVRGLLCSRCNLMLGMAEDNIELLQSAIEYLTKEES